MKAIVLLFAVMGCMTTPSVEVPQVLPSLHKPNHYILKQDHLLSEDERTTLLTPIRPIADGLNDRIDNTLWDYSWMIARKLKETDQYLVELMEQSKTLGEFKQYRLLFYQCTDLIQSMEFNWNGIARQLADITIKISQLQQQAWQEKQ